MLASSRTLRDTTLKGLYLHVLNLRKESLQLCESFALSYDGWKGNAVQRRLIGINYHWIDRNWVYHSATLDLVEVTAAHTGACRQCFFYNFILLIHFHSQRSIWSGC